MYPFVCITTQLNISSACKLPANYRWMALTNTSYELMLIHYLLMLQILHMAMCFKICTTISLFVPKRLRLSGYPSVVLAIDLEQYTPAT